VHLVGFVIRTYHDARSLERHIPRIIPLPVARRLLAVVSVSLALQQRHTFNPLKGVQRRKKAAKS